MDALGDCWNEDREPRLCHKDTLGMKTCIEALEGLEAETFVGLSSDACPQGGRGVKRYFEMLITPKSLRGRSSDDIWVTKHLNLHPSRLNLARPVNYLDFSPIANERSKFVIKSYVRHLLQETELMLSSIYESLIKLKEFALFMGDAPVEGATVEDVFLFERHCLSRGSVKYSYTKMGQIRKLFNWMQEEGFISDNPFLGYAIEDDCRRGMKVTAPDDFVIAQIAEVLPGLPLDLSLQYLILKCTGMRISELCQLRPGCLEKTAEGDCFVKFWNQKMSKDVRNVIPPSLYRLIAEYEDMIPHGSPYLFCAVKDLETPANCSRVVGRLSDALEEAGVKNPDGTPYRFAPHAMRHKMAVQLCEIDAPYKIIQEQLHHAEPDMAVAYTEFDIRRKAAKVSKFIDGNGVEKPCFVATARDVVETRVDWMRERLNAQILPNGICGRPVALGDCGKCNACLDCPDFRTSAEFLEVHMDHLARTRHFIETAKAAGWVNQLEGARRLKKKLETIIEKLEG